MSDYVKSLLRMVGIAAFVLLAIGFVGSSSVGVGFLLFVIVLPITGIAVAGLTVLYFIRSLELLRNSKSTPFRAGLLVSAPAAFVVLVMLAGPLFFAGKEIGTHALLLTEQDQYEAIIANVHANPTQVSFAKVDRITYSVDLGPPIRIAFNPDGYLGSWSGIVHDPSGEVMLINAIDEESGQSTAQERIRNVFEGVLVECRHLKGDYYRCFFD
ncbi:hypothetical protein [Erythrobacter sp. Alg231-14]|uniref:hypothetical protein n=1 Tax=Erythrobacter sp. Alg231-14 TaxID=1922225 RepID=UPI00307CA2CB